MSLALTLLLRFASMTLFAVGGTMVIVPELHRYLVEVSGLMSHETFNAAIAIGQTIPGPNSIISTILGWLIDGPAGALGATVGFLGPVLALAILVSKIQHRYDRTLALRAYRCGMNPVSIALMFSSGFLIARGNLAPAAIALTAVVTLLTWKTKLHFLWMLAAGALLGALGWV